MMMLTKEILKNLPALYSQENNPDPIVQVKFFTPWTSWSWFITEYSPDEKLFFGFVTSGMCPEGELGYTSLEEMEEIRGPGGLKIERDLHFRPCKLSEVMNKQVV